jgi:hypothetical protein
MWLPPEFSPKHSPIAICGECQSFKYWFFNQIRMFGYKVVDMFALIRLLYCWRKNNIQDVESLYRYDDYEWNWELMGQNIKIKC